MDNIAAGKDIDFLKYMNKYRLQGSITCFTSVMGLIYIISSFGYFKSGFFGPGIFEHVFLAIIYTAYQYYQSSKLDSEKNA